MAIRTLIEALGGPTEVASRLGLRINVVTNWSLRDTIPARHHLAVWRLALAAGVAWTPPGAEGSALTPAPRRSKSRALAAE